MKQDQYWQQKREDAQNRFGAIIALMIFAFILGLVVGLQIGSVS